MQKNIIQINKSSMIPHARCSQIYILAWGPEVVVDDDDDEFVTTVDHYWAVKPVELIGSILHSCIHPQSTSYTDHDSNMCTRCPTAQPEVCNICTAETARFMASESVTITGQRGPLIAHFTCMKRRTYIYCTWEENVMKTDEGDLYNHY